MLLLVVGCNAYQPIMEQSWIKFKDVKTPTYNDIPKADHYNILNAMTIEIKDRPSVVSKMVHKTARDFKKHLEAYTKTMKKRFKCANAANADYGFV